MIKSVLKSRLSVAHDFLPRLIIIVHNWAVTVSASYFNQIITVGLQ